MINIFEKIATMQKMNKVFMCITVVNKEGYAPTIIGTKMIVTSKGENFGTIGGGALEKIAVQKASELIIKQKSESIKFNLSEENLQPDESETGMICGGNVTLFFEYIGNESELLIFGAGHIGKALCYHLNKLPFCVSIIDTRKDELDAIHGVQNILLPKFTDYFDKYEMPLNCYIVIVTYSHKTDYQILYEIFKRNYSSKYIGIIASTNKAKEIVKALKKDFGNKIDIANLYTPIGLNIGGKAPEEIAISIISEIQAVKYDKISNSNIFKSMRMIEK